jgi:hypothetical protein
VGRGEAGCGLDQKQREKGGGKRKNLSFYEKDFKPLFIKRF